MNHGWLDYPFLFVWTIFPPRLERIWGIPRRTRCCCDYSVYIIYAGLSWPPGCSPWSPRSRTCSSSPPLGRPGPRSACLTSASGTMLPRRDTSLQFSWSSLSFRWWVFLNILTCQQFFSFWHQFIRIISVIQEMINPPHLCVFLFYTSRAYYLAWFNSHWYLLSISHTRVL